MNGALVIPNLMCINFYALKINKMGQLVAGPSVGLKDFCADSAGLAERFECLNALQVWRNIFKFMRLLFIPDDFVILM